MTLSSKNAHYHYDWMTNLIAVTFIAQLQTIILSTIILLDCFKQLLYNMFFNFIIVMQNLHKDILRKKPELTDLTEVASNLMALVGDDEASLLADKVQDTADRYSSLVDASDNLGQLLQASRAGLRHLVLTYQDLQAWMESMETRLSKYRVLAVHTDKLLEQMDDLAVSHFIFLTI